MLCPTRMRSPTISRTSGSTASAGGASSTISWVIPVSSTMKAGRAWRGLTSDL